MPVRVKICGVTRPEDARAAAAAGADYVGINFWPQSARAVDVERARTIAAAAGGVLLVGVFVDAGRDEVERVAERVGLSLLQFHGDESPAYCRGWSRPVIKAVRVRADASAAALAAPFAGVDYLLLDAWVAGRPGGTGQALAPAALAGMSGERLFLAGGLTPETVGEAVARVRPYGVDVASGVESHTGVKDHEKIRRFIERAKAA